MTQKNNKLIIQHKIFSLIVISIATFSSSATFAQPQNANQNSQSIPATVPENHEKKPTLKTSLSTNSDDTKEEPKKDEPKKCYDADGKEILCPQVEDSISKPPQPIENKDVSTSNIDATPQNNTNSSSVTKIPADKLSHVPAASHNIQTSQPEVVEVKNVDSTYSSPGMISVETVTQEEKAPPNTPVIIQGEKLEEIGVNNIADAMLLIPGAQIEYAMQKTRVSIDSLPSSHIVLLRDGVPVGRMTGNSAGSGTDYGAMAIDPSTVKEVEVIRGLGPNGTSGVMVNFISKKGQNFRASITGRYAHPILKHDTPKRPLRYEVLGSIDIPSNVFFHDSEGTPRILQELNLNLNGGFIHVNPIDFNVEFLKPEEVGKETFSSSQGQRNYIFSTQLGWTRHSDSLATSFSFEKDITRSVGDPSFDDIVINKEYNLDLNGHWNHPYGYVTHFTQYKYNDHNFQKMSKNEDKTDNKLIPKSHTLSNLVTQNIGSVFFVGDHDISGHLNLSGEWIQRTGDNYSLLVEGKKKKTVFVGNLSLGVGDHWYINPQLDLEGEFRATVSKPYGPQLEGLLKLGWKPNKYFRSRLILTRSRRVPTGEELYQFFNHEEVGYVVAGNPNLQPEMLHSIKAEFGGRYKIFGLTLSPFFHYILSAIVPADADKSVLEGTSAKIAFTYSNAEKVMTAGMNIIFDLDLPFNLSLHGTYTYTPLANQLDEKGNLDSRIQLRPEHVFRSELNWKWFSNKLGVRVWVDGRGPLPRAGVDLLKDIDQKYLDDPEMVKIAKYEAPGLAQVNFGIDYKPWSWLKAGVDVRNVANTIDVVYGPSTGRHIMATLQFIQEGWPWRGDGLDQLPTSEQLEAESKSNSELNKPTPTDKKQIEVVEVPIDSANSPETDAASPTENTGASPTENTGTPPTENTGASPTENTGTPPTENTGTKP